MWKLETVKQVAQHWDQKKKIKMQGMQKNEKKKQQTNKGKEVLILYYMPHFHSQ